MILLCTFYDTQQYMSFIGEKTRVNNGYLSCFQILFPYFYKHKSRSSNGEDGSG